MADPHFEILAPAQWSTPAVFNSPHSGTHLPSAFLHQSRLAAAALRQSEDCFVDELFSGCQTAGAPLLRATISRAYIDLNREPFELDARMFWENVPGHMQSTSPRVASGLGTIPKIVAEGEDIYRGRIHLGEALNRIETIYRPYHRTLNALLNECYNATGFSLLVDCHSMPSSAVKAHHGRNTDIVLGDRFGTACDAEISTLLEDLLYQAGFSIVRNKPYAGGFITETHGAPRHNRHALQIEVNRALYMDEDNLQKNSAFKDIHARLSDVIVGLLAALPQAQTAEPVKLAAE
jgi:N-formylglutamate amidohydrolase